VAINTESAIQFLKEIRHRLLLGESGFPIFFIDFDDTLVLSETTRSAIPNSLQTLGGNDPYLELSGHPKILQNILEKISKSPVWNSYIFKHDSAPRSILTTGLVETQILKIVPTFTKNKPLPVFITETGNNKIILMIRFLEFAERFIPHFHFRVGDIVFLDDRADLFLTPENIQNILRAESQGFRIKVVKIFHSGPIDIPTVTQLWPVEIFSKPSTTDPSRSSPR